jgi:hypothetical protein
MSQETLTANDILRQSLDRNRYFYGKLMTVRDFTQEQLYFNAKRWLLNRLLFGSGVIYGLKVSAVTGEPTSIVIAPGLALDPLGREVTVEAVAGGNDVDLAGVKVDLTSLVPKPTVGNYADGFICLSYRVCPKDPVPSLKSSSCDQGCESNRWSETFEVSWDPDTNPTVDPTLCQSWLNRVTVSDANDDFRIERTTPLRVSENEVFEVVVRVTAKKKATNVTITEKPSNATPIDPTPTLPAGTLFPTPPVNLQAGEFFVYVYQLKAASSAGTSLTVKTDTAGVPGLTSTVEVLTAQAAKEAAENQSVIENDAAEPKSTCIRIAKLRAQFNVNLAGFTIQDFAAPRFRYNFEHVNEMLDCMRASFLARAGSSRPGHAFITFNDLETKEPQLIGANGNAGSAFTAARGDHVHKLKFAGDSGLEFVANTSDLRINGRVGGQVEFLNTVKGVSPLQDKDLVTKDYVDAHIAGLDWKESVLSRKETVPPEAEVGDRYLLFDEPTKKWPGAGKVIGAKNDIATFNGKTWDFVTPNEGAAVFVEDENVAYLFMDDKWTAFLAAPTVAAGAGLTADDKAVFSVGQGKGIVVSDSDVSVNFSGKPPNPIGVKAAAGSSGAAADGDHVHTLPLNGEGGGLAFDKFGLRIDGEIASEKIVFRRQVSGQDPESPEHLATRRYVDDHVDAIEAGDGLVRKVNTILVGQGAGIKVNADDVAVAFETASVQPIGASASVGKLKTVADGGHVHALPLSEVSGLVIDDKGLRIDGTVGGKTTFVNQVAGPDPNLAEHFATKRYVDKQIVPAPAVVAGGGLVLTDHTMSVGQGDGLLLGEDSLAVQFADSLPQPDNDKGDPGKAVEASRGDHVHPLPQVTPGSASGIVTFRFEGKPQFTAQADVDPGLGSNTICVELAFVTPSSYDFGVGLNANLLGVPPMILAAEVRPPREQLSLTGRGVALAQGTTFRILVDASHSENALPEVFQIRWFAYSAAVEKPATEVVIPPPPPPKTLTGDEPEL